MPPFREVSAKRFALTARTLKSHPKPYIGRIVEIRAAGRKRSRSLVQKRDERILRAEPREVLQAVRQRRKGSQEAVGAKHDLGRRRGVKNLDETIGHETAVDCAVGERVVGFDVAKGVLYPDERQEGLREGRNAPLLFRCRQPQREAGANDGRAERVAIRSIAFSPKTRGVVEAKMTIPDAPRFPARSL